MSDDADNTNAQKTCPVSQWGYLWFSFGYLIKWGGYAVLIGAAVGAVSFAFEWTLHWLQETTSHTWLWGTPIAGGLLVAVVIRHEKRAASDGIQVYIDGVMTERGWLDKLLLPLKFVATVFTMGTGGSGGRVGPMVLMGGSAGSWASVLSDKRREADHPTATMCGAAAAIGALLRTPLGGGIFAAEVLFPNSIRYHGLFPAILASTVAHVVRSRLFPPVWPPAVPRHTFAMEEMFPVFCVAVVAGLVGLGFVLLYRRCETLSLRFRAQAWVLPAIGAAAVVALGWLTVAISSAEGTEIMGPGAPLFYRMIDQNGAPLALWLAVVLLVTKSLATILTVSSGGSGGLFFPALLIGGLAGCVVSQVIDAGAVLHLGLVAAGMAAGLASIINVPVAAAVMMIEMFGADFSVPVILGAAAGFIIGRPGVIYHYGHHTVIPRETVEPETPPDAT